MAGVYHTQSWGIQSTGNNPFVFDDSKQKAVSTTQFKECTYIISQWVILSGQIDSVSSIFLANLDILNNIEVLFKYKL